MRFNGVWRTFEDGVERPILQAEVRGAQGGWRACQWLIDTGADQTVFSADVAGISGFDDIGAATNLVGIGGAIQAVSVRTALRVRRSDEQAVLLNGQFAACLDPQALEISVLGRDILDMFSVIYDRPSGVIAMLSGRHRYLIVG